MDNSDNSGLLSSIIDFIDDILEGILNLPHLILEGIKSIFIPDVEVIKDQFSNTIDNIIRTFNLDTSSFSMFVDGLTEEAVSDVKADYNILGVGTFNLTFFDSSFLVDGVDFFRPLIRGFIVLMLLFFNYKQMLSFIGQDPSIAHNAQQEYQKFMDKGGK